jgi:hypothetical protein
MASLGVSGSTTFSMLPSLATSPAIGVLGFHAGQSSTALGAPLAQNRHIALRMRVREVGNPASEVDAGTCLHVGVSWAPDGRLEPQTQNFLAQLNALQGPAFDAAFVNAQLAVMTEAESQFGAYSQNAGSGPLRRSAQVILPKARVQLEYARGNAAKP